MSNDQVNREDGAREIVKKISDAALELADDGWVTFGRVKVDIENETETFERINPPVPASPAALRDEADDDPPRGYWPTLLDRGDGVSGHFCIGRLSHPASPYWEFWNKGQWTSAGEVFIGREAAQKQLDTLREDLRTTTTTPSSTLARKAAEEIGALRKEAELIAVKWAETLSEGEQSVLLTSSIRRLQSMITAIIKRCFAAESEGETDTEKNSKEKD